jgi:hypothetical protein
MISFKISNLPYQYVIILLLSYFILIVCFLDLLQKFLNFFFYFLSSLFFILGKYKHMQLFNSGI